MVAGEGGDGTTMKPLSDTQQQTGAASKYSASTQVCGSSADQVVLQVPDESGTVVEVTAGAPPPPWGACRWWPFWRRSEVAAAAEGRSRPRASTSSLVSTLSIGPPTNASGCCGGGCCKCCSSKPHILTATNSGGARPASSSGAPYQPPEAATAEAADSVTYTVWSSGASGAVPRRLCSFNGMRGPPPAQMLYNPVFSTSGKSSWRSGSAASSVAPSVAATPRGAGRGLTHAVGGGWGSNRSSLELHPPAPFGAFVALRASSDGAWAGAQGDSSTQAAAASGDGVVLINHATAAAAAAAQQLLPPAPKPAKAQRVSQGGWVPRISEARHEDEEESSPGVKSLAGSYHHQQECESGCAPSGLMEGDLVDTPGRVVGVITLQGEGLACCPFAGSHSFDSGGSSTPSPPKNLH
jgi:hypothetical protein